MYNIKQQLLTENIYDEGNSRYVLVRCSVIVSRHMVKLAEDFQILGASISLRHIFVTLGLLECSSGLFFRLGEDSCFCLIVDDSWEDTE